MVEGSFGRKKIRNLHKISYPSDRISLGQFREHVGYGLEMFLGPEQLSADDPAQGLARKVVRMLLIEQNIAKAAVERAENGDLATPFGHVSAREKAVSNLTDFYQEFGLVHGREETKELVRAIEQAAVASMTRRPR